MSDWWIECGDGDPIRQGDVVRRTTAAGEVAWGMIVTADCDIAQGKAGDRFTWLRIVPSHEYLRDRWAPEQLRRLVARHMRPTAEALTGLLRKCDATTGPLTEASLHRWLETHSPEQILDLAAPGKAPDGKLLKPLHALRLAIAEGDALERLRRSWTALGHDAAKQAGAVRNAFEGERGFPDFFLLPDLPRGEGYGHVVLLRDIGSLAAGELFTTELDARLAGRPHAFHRTVRLHDGIRFAVTQKLAFLFSRIGLSTRFEQACASATELVVEALQHQE